MKARWAQTGKSIALSIIFKKPSDKEFIACKIFKICSWRTIHGVSTSDKYQRFSATQVYCKSKIIFLLACHLMVYSLSKLLVGEHTHKETISH